MTISSDVNRNNYTGNGSANTYSYTFRIFDEDNLTVTVKNTSDVETTLTKTTDYTVTGVGESGGGTIVLVNASQAWLTGANLTTDFIISVRRVRPLTQGTDIRNQGSFFPETHEDVFDKLVMNDQQQQDEIDRSIKLPESIDPSAFDASLPAALAGSVSVAIITNATGDGLAVGPSSSAISGANASAIAAAASETNAGISETNAAASAAVAQNAAASVIWNDVVFLTNADSPYTVTNSQRGKLLAVDCTSGAVTINLPSIAALDLDSPFVLGIKKTDGSGNGITINGDGTDEIDGLTSKTISVAQSGATLIPDTDPTPDAWTSSDFGASAGNLTVDAFSGDSSTTGFTLSVDPGSENNTFVYIDGVYQEKDTYSVSGTTLTFSSAPPTGTSNIEAVSGTLLSIGVPSDATVTTAKIVDANVTKVKLADGAIANDDVNSETASFTVAVTETMNLVSTAAGAVTATLPTAVGNSGLRMFFKKTTDDVNALTIDGNASETINSIASIIVPKFNNWIELISDGSNWHIINENREIRSESKNSSGSAVTAATERIDWTVVEDICSLWSTIDNGADRLTAKEAGTYYFRGNVAMTTNNSNRMYMFLNNDTGYTRLLFDAATYANADHLPVDQIIYLNVGDYVDFRFSDTATLDTSAGNTDHWLEVIKIK
jgi:hypothetical protein